MTRVIAVTGGIATGKSEASAILKSLGAIVIDADQIARSQSAPGGAALPAIRAAFGDGVFSGEALDRKALANEVFSNENSRKRLNEITHPLVYNEIESCLDEALNAGAPLVALDIPLLFETGYPTRAGEVWLIYAPFETQMERLARRDNLTRDQALGRIRAQMPIESKRALADVIIENTGSPADLRAEIEKQVNRLMAQGGA